MNDELFPRQGYLILQGWEGRTETLCEVLEETPKRYRIKALIGMRLGGPGRWLDKGETALVPKRAILLLPQPGDDIEELCQSQIEGGTDAITNAET